LKHSTATIGIQRRLEKWELDHLRALCAVQAEEIERLQRELIYAEDCAVMWQRGHEQLAEHLDQQHAVGLTLSSDILVVAAEGGAS
jgi:anaerobic selenocysteine-containing dehydrogenase